MEAARVSPYRSRPRGWTLAAALALLCAISVAPAADAQDPGVVYEPGSPSDKEYAIPLEEVRRDAGGEQPGKIEGLPFGIGLSRRGGGEPGARGAGARGGTDDAGRDDRSSRAQAGAGSRRASRDLGDRLADAEDAGAPSLWRLGPLLLVLLPSLLVGLLLARRDRGGPTAAT